jgi:hypothetical protein
MAFTSEGTLAVPMLISVPEVCIELNSAVLETPLKERGAARCDQQCWFFASLAAHHHGLRPSVVGERDGSDLDRSGRH